MTYNPFSIKKDMHMASLKIIIVEDDHELRDILVTGLTLLGHEVRSARNGAELDATLPDFHADIIILDLGLPGEDGISIAKRIRRNNKCGVVVITARGKISERILGHEAGADLYFVKPVDIRELDAAIRNLSSRITGTKPSCWHFDPITSQLTTPAGAPVFLTAQECILTVKLLAHPGTNVSRKEIFDALQQPDDLYADKRLETMISRLRAKVRAADPACTLPIRARHNLGYAFLGEITVPSR